MAFFRFRHSIQNAFPFFVGLAARELAINLSSLNLGAPIALHHLDCLSVILHRAHSVSIAAVIGGNALGFNCRMVMMSATDPMINIAANQVRSVTTSCAKRAPSNTATIGLT